MLHAWGFDFRRMCCSSCFSACLSVISLLLSVMRCWLYWRAPACWFITPAFGCLSSPCDCVVGAPVCHFWVCQIVARFSMRDAWLEGHPANRRMSTVWGRRRWGEKEGSKSLCALWLGCSRRHRQHFPQRVAGEQGRAVGEIFLMYVVAVHQCVCVCTWRTLITLIISSNYLQTANEFLRNPIMLCMCSHHHPFCTAAINLLINKYN